MTFDNLNGCRKLLKIKDGGEGGIRTRVEDFGPQLDFELVNAIIPPIPVCQVPASFYSHPQISQHFNQLQPDCVGSRMIGADGNELVSNLNTEAIPGAIGFCEHCQLPIYDNAISNHILFRCNKYQPKFMLTRVSNGSNQDR